MSLRWDEELTESEHLDTIVIDDEVCVFKFRDEEIDGTILACYNHNQGWRFRFYEGDEYDGLIEALIDEGCNASGEILAKRKDLRPYDYVDPESMAGTRVFHSVDSNSGEICIRRRSEALSYASKFTEYIGEAE